MAVIVDQMLAGLDEQDRAVLAGLDPRDAISALLDANRAERGDQREIALRDLRILAALRERPAEVAVRSPRLSSQPVELRETDDGLPVVTPGELSLAALTAGLRAKGCLLVRGLMDGDRARFHREGIDRAVAIRKERDRTETSWLSPAPPVGDVSVSGVARQWTFKEGGLLTVDSPRLLFELLEDATRGGLVDLAEQYLGERPALAAEKAYLRNFPGPGYIDNSWHQDGSFIGTSSVLNAWITFSDCGRIAPGMELLLRRMSDVYDSDDRSDFTWSLSDQQVRTLASNGDLVVPEFRAGDCLLFDQLFVHRTFRSESMTEPRYSAETWFFAPSTMIHSYVPVLV